MSKLAEHLAGQIQELGYELSDPHLTDSPARIARFLKSWHTKGVEPPKLTLFPNEAPRASGLVVTERLPFYSLCAHHGLPFFGEATVGYIPGTHLLGLSKLARVVDHFAHRFQTQERLTEEVADHFLSSALEPVGLGVITRAEHLCMSMRGVSKPGHRTTYSALRGALFKVPEARAEFLTLTVGR